MARKKKEKNGLYRKNLVVGKKADGSYIRRTVYAKTQKELEEIRSIIDSAEKEI